MKIDLDTGKIAAKAQTEVELGNLVCYKDQLISQSPQTVASFVLLSESLQKQLDERLAAESARHRGPAAAGADSAAGRQGRRIAEAAAARPTRSLPTRRPSAACLAKVMLAMLRQDFAANLELTDELDKLVTDPAQRREVLRFRVQGLARTNRTWEALAALLGAGRSGAGSAADRCHGRRRAAVRRARPGRRGPTAGFRAR